MPKAWITSGFKIAVQLTWESLWILITVLTRWYFVISARFEMDVYSWSSCLALETVLTCHLDCRFVWYIQASANARFHSSIQLALPVSHCEEIKRFNAVLGTNSSSIRLLPTVFVLFDLVNGMYELFSRWCKAPIAFASSASTLTSSL